MMAVTTLSCHYRTMFLRLKDCWNSPWWSSYDTWGIMGVCSC